MWPGQAADTLRGLIHQANLARDQGLASVPDEAAAEHLRLFRNGVSVGLSRIRRLPGGTKVKQLPARMLLECLRDREADVLRFLTDTAIPPTSNQAERDVRPPQTQQKIPAGFRSGETTRDRYAIRGYASTAINTDTRSSPRSAAPSPATPGYRPSRQPPEPHPKPVTHRYTCVTGGSECLRRQVSAPSQNPPPP